MPRLAYAGHVPVLNQAEATQVSAELSGRVDLPVKAVHGRVNVTLNGALFRPARAVAPRPKPSGESI